MVLRNINQKYKKKKKKMKKGTRWFCLLFTFVTIVFSFIVELLVTHLLTESQQFVVHFIFNFFSTDLFSVFVVIIFFLFRFVC